MNGHLRSRSACLKGVMNGSGRPHSITSSARASSEGAPVKPRALAVLRLITSSNLVGNCTGRLPGFAPLSKPVGTSQRCQDRLSSGQGAHASRWSISCTTAGHDEDAARPATTWSKGIPVGLNRSTVQHIRFAMGSVATSVDRECRRPSAQLLLAPARSRSIS
jgi:hypothetical protein